LSLVFLGDVVLTFKEIAPFVIADTLLISTLIAIKIRKKDIFSTDGIFSVIGFGLGLIITFLNLIYSNNYLISLGPLLAIASLLYLRFRNKILTESMDFNLNFYIKTLKVINILYWISIFVALTSYHQAPPYYRPPIFFISISLGVSLLGLEIVSSRFKDNFNIFGMMFKILLISLILRGSAYFISPYPIGSDPWFHADLIKDISSFGTLNVPLTYAAKYYVNYPLMHIFASTICLIENMSVKESMFFIGALLALSTVFVYLIVKKMTGNINLAFLSMLLLNFADFHIEWSIEIIAMSFGIAIYTILLYLILKRDENNHQGLYASFSVMFLFIIIWTHTVSGFIALISIISLYVGSLIYQIIYGKKGDDSLLISFAFTTIFIVLLLYHWIDPNYPFLEGIAKGLINSLSSEAKFLGRTTISNVAESWRTILDIFGFLAYVFFGILGIFYSLSKRNATKAKFSWIFMLVVLSFVFFVFPVFGLKSIVPYRWPAFIYTSFVLFVGIGVIECLSILNGKHQRIVFILLVMLISSFLMITNNFVNMDSPVYGTEINRKLVWTESEIKLFERINNSYDGVVVADLQTTEQIFQIYLKRKETVDYRLTTERNMNWEYMNNKLVIWRKISLTESLQVSGYRNPYMLLGDEVKNRLDSNFSNIYDTGEARAYLKISR
jgi:hypothetical protein